MASFYYEEKLDNNDTELDWDIDLRDLNNQTFLQLGGWNELGTPGDLSTIKAKPNGVDIREWFYRDQLSAEEWGALEQEASFSWPDFNWADVGILIRELDKDDYDGDGEYRTKIEYDFIKQDPNSGRHDWDYFSTETVEGGVTEIQDGDGNVIGFDYPAGQESVALADAMSPDMAKLAALLDAHLYTHQFRDLDIPLFSAGEFKATGNSILWSQNDGQSQLSLFGQFEYSDTVNEWGDKDFYIRFDRPDGEPMVELRGWVSVGENDEADYYDAEIRISEYVYKTDLASLTTPKENNAEWDDTMTTYGPSDTFIPQMGDGADNIWDETSAPNVEVIELSHRYRYRDDELKDFDHTSESPSGIHYTADRIEARFMEGTVQSNDELDIEWSWETDYSIEFSGGVAALMQGDNQIALELIPNRGSTPIPFDSHPDLCRSKYWAKYLDAIIAKWSGRGSYYRI